jgi:hypothetical protein
MAGTEFIRDMVLPERRARRQFAGDDALGKGGGDAKCNRVGSLSNLYIIY